MRSRIIGGFLAASILSVPIAAEAHTGTKAARYHAKNPGCHYPACDKRVGHRWAVQHRPKHATVRASSGWVIPAYIVMCESHGQNLPPNGAGASGYYQIIPSTWSAYGGTAYASQAYLAPKWAQDKIAARIWAQGGASQWDCA
jgi:hypothetical protein